MLTIEGIAQIGKGSFRFDGGLPSNLSVVEPQHLLGRLHIDANANAVFSPDRRVTNQPPVMCSVSEGEDYRLKRTSLNYFIQIRVPIDQTRAETQCRLEALLPVIMGDITLDRRELFSQLVG